MCTQTICKHEEWHLKALSMSIVFYWMKNYYLHFHFGWITIDLLRGISLNDICSNKYRNFNFVFRFLIAYLILNADTREVLFKICVFFLIHYFSKYPRFKRLRWIVGLKFVLQITTTHKYFRQNVRVSCYCF